jgi:hypothetical protein
MRHHHPHAHGAWLVRERGPETFTPNMAGGITPNGAGSTVTVHNNFSFASGVTRTELAALLRMMEKRTAAAVFAAMQQHGGASRLIGARA